MAAAAKDNGGGNATVAESLNGDVSYSEQVASLRLSLGKAYEFEGRSNNGMELFPLIEALDTSSYGVKEENIGAVEECSGGCTTGLLGCSLDHEKLRQTVAVAMRPSVGPTSLGETNIGFGRPMQTANVNVYDNPSTQYGSQISTEVDQGISTKGREIELTNALPELVAAAVAGVEKEKSVSTDQARAIESSDDSEKDDFRDPEMVQIGTEMLDKMPTVITKGGRANVRKIEGFLYKYVNSEVCIVCVCHGKFFSPAEFIKHAGGDDVENPMKHITVLTTCHW